MTVCGKGHRPCILNPTAEREALLAGVRELLKLNIGRRRFSRFPALNRFRVFAERRRNASIDWPERILAHSKTFGLIPTA